MSKKIEAVIIVEGTTDELFINSLAKYIKPNNNADVISISYQHIGGSDIAALAKQLKSLRADFRNKPINKVGIILDLDEYTIEQRLEHIKDALQNAGIQIQITSENTAFDYKINENRTIQFYCHFIKVENNKCNIETLMMSIANQPTTSAMCLQNWKSCSENSGIKIKESDFAKEQLKTYVRYDYCNDKTLSKHASENCTVEKSLENMFKEQIPKAWNFESEKLTSLKEFLSSILT